MSKFYNNVLRESKDSNSVNIFLTLLYFIFIYKNVKINVRYLNNNIKTKILYATLLLSKLKLIDYEFRSAILHIYAKEELLNACKFIFAFDTYYIKSLALHFKQV